MGVVLFFVDGVGVGRPDPENVFFRRRERGAGGLFHFADDRLGLDGADALPDGWRGRTLDATLGVEGLPQSATGQATIFTGINAAARLGHHQPAFPGSVVSKLVLDHSLLRRHAADGRAVTFANAYGPSFPGHREAPDPTLPPPRRSSVSTLAAWSAGLRFRTYDDLDAGRAVYHDITRWTTGHRGPALDPITPERAGADVAGLAREHDLVVHEHFLLDLIGHGRIDADVDAIVDDVDRFVGAATAALDPERDAAIVVSDHGNVEDPSVRTHTRNPVPFLGWGRAAAAVAEPGSGSDLTTVTPTVARVLAEASCPND